MSQGQGAIAYVVKMFPRLSETFIVNEVLELERRGVELEIVSLMRPNGAVHSPEALRLSERAHLLPQHGDRGQRRAVLRAHLFLARRDPGRYAHVLWLVARRLSWSAWKRFAQGGSVAHFCLERRIAHIHAGFAHVPASVAWWASRLTGIPFSFAAHAKDLYLSEARSLRHKMDAARFVWTCTEANGTFLRSLGSATPVHVGYHGCDLARWSPAAASPPRAGSPALLAVGRLVPKKGLDDLLRALAILAGRGIEANARIVGDGPERGNLERLAGELGISERVRFLGSLRPEEVREEYARAGLAVLPSVILENGDRDGIPNVLVEAMAMGVPIVSTRVPGILELVRDGETGVLVAPRDPPALAGAIEESLARPETARARAQRARSDVAARFDLRANSARLAGLLERHREATRCLYVSADLGIPIRGHKGASAHVRQICGRLAEAGLDVLVVTPSPGPLEPEGNRFDLPIEETPPPRWTDRWVARTRDPDLRAFAKEARRLLHNLAVARRVAALTRMTRPDFVLERYALCSFATGWICRRRRIPWLLEVNAPLVDEEKRFRDLRWGAPARAIERWVLRHADHVFVVSRALRRWALEQGVHPDRVSVLANGVDLRRFHRGIDGSPAREAWGFGADAVVLAFSGSLKPWHGVRLLLEAFAEARRAEPRLRLVLIGDGPERKGLVKATRARGLEEVVRFTGAVPQDDVPALLRAADVLVAPFLPLEGFYFQPLKVLEYLAVGRPVIASRVGDLPSLVEAPCGILVRPGDRADLIRAILELSGDPERREIAGRRAAARARSEDWSVRAERILETVRELRAPLAGRAPRVGYVLKMFPRFSETFIVNEILELERQGVEVRIFSMKQPSGPRQDGADQVAARASVLPRPSRLLDPRVLAAHTRNFARSPRRTLRALAFAVGRRDARALTKFVQAGVVADAVSRERIAHLHAHFASGPARVAKLAGMISGVPFSFTAHAKDLYWEGHRHHESHKLKKRVKLARFVVAVSRENQRFIESLGFRVKEGRVRSIYIGLRLDEFPFTSPLARRDSPRPLVLGVGRLIEKKGFHILIEALARLKAEGIRFRCAIAGEGPERRRLENLARALGLRGDVRFLGAVPLARLRRSYYSRARLLAQPCVVAADGDRDGIPTVLLESMALGVPVVSTRVSGIPEAIEDGVDGFLTEPGDVGLLADRIRALLIDRGLCERLARAGRSRVERQFDLRANAGSLRKLFLRSIHGWPPSVALAGSGEEPATATPAVATAASDSDHASAHASAGYGR